MVALDRYLKKHGITQQGFAERLRCSQSLVSQWLSGDTRMTAQWAVLIERETNGEVKRQHLLPDIYRGMEAA